MILALALAALAAPMQAEKGSPGGSGEGQSIYDLTVTDIDGKDVKLDRYKGQVLLIVNVASL